MNILHYKNTIPRLSNWGNFLLNVVELSVPYSFIVEFKSRFNWFEIMSILYKIKRKNVKCKSREKKMEILAFGVVQPDSGQDTRVDSSDFDFRLRSKLILRVGQIFSTVLTLRKLETLILFLLR